MKYSITITGVPRKEAAEITAAGLYTNPVYKGVPSLDYEAVDEKLGPWRITNDARIVTPEFEPEDLPRILRVFEMLTEQKVKAVENTAEFLIKIENYDSTSLRNLVNMIYQKERLLIKVFGTETDHLVTPSFVEEVNEQKPETVEDFLSLAKEEELFKENSIVFNWFLSTLEPNRIKAYVQFLHGLNRLALNQSRALAKPSETNNDRYSFRVWLLRMRFIGEEYETSRRILLAPLTGNPSYRAKKTS